VTDSKLVDSSVWIAYLVNRSFKEVFESDEPIFLSVLSLFEIKKILEKQGVDSEKIAKGVAFIKKRSFLVNVDANLSEFAADISIQHKLPALDALIYASALKNNAVLITLDNDFRGLKNVVVLD